MSEEIQNQNVNNNQSNNNQSNEEKATQMANESKNLQDMMALIDKQEKSSEIASLTGKPTFLTINKGKKNEYTLEVIFPGVAKASSLRDDARTPMGIIDQTYFMKNVAIKELIVRPKIYSLDWFDKRGGYDDAYNKILDWFRSSINGEAYSEED